MGSSEDRIGATGGMAYDLQTLNDAISIRRQ
jgi:hypothetical protein